MDLNRKRLKTLERVRRFREKETIEQKEERKRKNAEHMKKVRENESVEQKEERKRKNAENMRKTREEKKDLPGCGLYAAGNHEWRIRKLEAEYPDLFYDFYFCYSLDFEAAQKEGVLVGRNKCPNCGQMHWKKRWSK
jgi:hypothetical protein